MGSSPTVINGVDLISDSRTVINNNFTSLYNGKQAVIASTTGQLIVNNGTAVAGATDATYDAASGIYLFGTLVGTQTLSEPGKMFVQATQSAIIAANLAASTTQSSWQNLSGGTSTSLVRGINASVNILNTDTTTFTPSLTNNRDGMSAIIGTVAHQGTGTVNRMAGVTGKLQLIGSSSPAHPAGTVADAAVVRALGTTISNGSAVTSLASFRAMTPIINAGSIDTTYGLLVDAMLGTVKWGVYVTSDPSFFGGGIQAPLTTPATSSAAGVQGTICWDANFIYVCTATNTWKRTAITTW